MVYLEKIVIKVENVTFRLVRNFKYVAALASLTSVRKRKSPLNNSVPESLDGF
jgi:hypothetical protein